MHKSTRTQPAYRVGEWLPSDQAFLIKWLEAMINKTQAEPRALHPVIAEFEQLIESDPQIFMLFNQMFEQVPKRAPYDKDPAGKPQVRDYRHMLRLLNTIMTHAPEFDRSGLVGCPTIMGKNRGSTQATSPSMHDSRRWRDKSGKLRMCKYRLPSQHASMRSRQALGFTLFLRRVFLTGALAGLAASLIAITGACQEARDDRDPSFESLWFSTGHPTQQALALLSEMRRAEERGLRPADYTNLELKRIEPTSDTHTASGTTASAAMKSGTATSAEMARLDAQLSRAASRFVSDLHNGRVDPSAVGFDLDIVRPPFDVSAAVAALATAPSVAAELDALEPQFLHYKLLKQALARYRGLALQPELNVLPDPGKNSIKPGGLYAGSPALRTLLTTLGDMPATVGQAVPSGDLLAVLDTQTVQALKHFQGRHGLTQDGALGRETYRALTTPFAERVRQIELSLERWRWLPPKLQTPPIMVNIPEFRLFALYTTADIEQQMLRMDVIVGKSFPLLQTPVFAADMRYLVIHPYWDVPYSIVKRELLPLIRRDPHYIARNDYEIVRGQTDAAEVQPVTAETVVALEQGSLRLRQRPGPKNPLGFVKFMLPNKYNVYLHGTSAPALFGGAQRAFSHGCIRVADPMGLMSYVLRDNPESDRDRVEELLQEPGPHRINLRNPIRVFIVYTTALAAEDGRTLFFKDIYGHNARLQALLDARSKVTLGR